MQFHPVGIVISVNKVSNLVVALFPTPTEEAFLWGEEIAVHFQPDSDDREHETTDHLIHFVKCQTCQDQPWCIYHRRSRGLEVRSPSDRQTCQHLLLPMCQKYELLLQQQFTCNFCCSIYSELL